ncbi:hypothetical protein GCM10022277_25140 [Litoribacillus peritrichatus]|uniref:Alginate export domain-containing protein n=2 Tax=Litoribacillus peritrichatus TaxID=718191 RepID=A0ABP7MPT2_9GAMM
MFGALMTGAINYAHAESPFSAISSEGFRNGEFTALFSQELAVDTKGHRQKMETLVEPQWQGDISEAASLIAIGRLRLDWFDRVGPDAHKADNYGDLSAPLYNSAHGELSLREFFLDTELFGGYLRLGKQQVVWGQADGLKVLDVVNPQSYREFILDDFDDSRIPLWMVNYEMEVADEASIQLLWIPDLTFHELAERDKLFALSTPEIIPQSPSGVPVFIDDPQKPNDPWGDSEFGFKYGVFYQGWDFTLNYFYHFQDTPVLYQTVSESGVRVTPGYERNHLMGATASNAFGAFTLRAEVGFNSDSYQLSDDLSENGVISSRELASVFGVDWQGIENVFLSAQWLQSHLLDYDQSIVRRQSKNTFTLLYRHHFENETWELEVLELHTLERKDGVVQTKLSHLVESNLEAWVGLDVFYGSEEGVFGQYDQNDRWTFGIEWGI